MGAVLPGGGFKQDNYGTGGERGYNGNWLSQDELE